MYPPFFELRVVPPPAHHERGEGVHETLTPWGGLRGYLTLIGWGGTSWHQRGVPPRFARETVVVGMGLPSEIENRNRVGVPPHVPDVGGGGHCTQDPVVGVRGVT